MSISMLCEVFLTLVFFHTSNGTLKHVLVTVILWSFDKYHNNEANFVWNFMPLFDSGAERLVRYYVKPNELFCVALKVRASHHIFY